MKKAAAAFLIAAFVVAGATAACGAGGSLSNFEKVNTYKDGMFSDVSESDWYVENVRTSYEMGLFLGTGDGRFVPSGNISTGEMLAVACRIHSIYSGRGADFELTNPWYEAYADYAVKNGIIKEGEFKNLTKPATRGQFAYVFENALPDGEFKAVNNVEEGSLPDVRGNEYYGKAVYTLYNAGIIIGADEYGTFGPDMEIERSAVAAIATRMADTKLRLERNIKPAFITVSTDSFSVSVPAELFSICDVETDGDSIGFYEKIAHKTLYGGRVFVITALDEDTANSEESFYYWEFGQKFGVLTDNGENKYLFVTYPSDVQWHEGIQASFDNYWQISAQESGILETLTPNRGTYTKTQESPNWKAAFTEVINYMAEANKNGWNSPKSYQGYTLYDIDKDGTPEFFALFGSCEADYQWEIYRFNKAKGTGDRIADIPGGHSAISGADGENAFYLHWGNMGYEKIVKYTFSHGTFEEKIMYEGEADGDYTPLKHCRLIDISYNPSFIWENNDDSGNRALAENK